MGRYGLAIVLLFAAQGFAESAEVMADKISTLLQSANCSFAQPPNNSKSIELFYLRGSPVDSINAPEAAEKLLNIVRAVASKLGHLAKAEGKHHTSWREVCDAMKGSTADSLVLVGHSYGAAGSVKVAHCLKEVGKTVDFLVTISSYDFFAGVDVTKIPDNVNRHYNYWTTDPSMPGYKNHLADDPAKTFVRNVLAKHDSNFPHLKVAEDIVSLIGLQIFAHSEGHDDNVRIPDEFDGNHTDNNIANFWNCH